MISQPGCQGSRIFNDLLLINLKIWTKRLPKAHSLGGDDMHERPPLHTRKHHRIDFLSVFFPAQDQTTTRPPQGLVGGGSDEVCMRYGCRVNPRGNQPRDMSHIHKKIGPHLFRYPAHPLVVHDPGVGACSTGYQFRLHLSGG